ncbi:MAG: AsmA-like C-terminal region-containing protein, partial [Terracidiphilus sp.]
PEMTEKAPALWRRSKRTRFFLIAFCTVLILILTGLILLAHYWPFKQKDIVETLQETVPGTIVKITRFHSTYFPHPGCWAEGVVFLRQASRPGLPPLITVQKLVIQANYPDLFLRPGYISHIALDGLHIQVPPRGSSIELNNASPSGTLDKGTVVGEISSTGALLEIGRRDNSPLQFEIHDIKVTSAGVDKVMSYNVTLHNPLPPGEIQSTGKLGPWNSQQVGQIPTSGAYKFEQADLGVFPGIGGVLASTGRFEGTLGQIKIAGETETPGFIVKASGHPFPLKSSFQAEVNGTNGDVILNRVDALLLNTHVAVRGAILGKSPLPGKTTSLDLLSQEAHVQDVLRPFVKAPQPPMAGPMTFRAHVTLPSGDRPFFKRIKLAGDFTIHDGLFPKPDTQDHVNQLSASSRGLKDKPGGSETVKSNLVAHVELSDSIAKFSNLSFNVPGALARMNGSFNVVNEKVDFHGTLKTDVELSKTTHGIKALLLKPLDPIFKRKRAGAAIPVEITGTYSNAHFGMEIVPKH